MSRRRLTLAAVLGALTVVALVLLFRARGADVVRTRMTGDVQEQLTAVAAEDLPARARGFLQTDRPWRAAQAMERYLDATAEPSDADRVLAARAQAGWGDWPAALELLRQVGSLEAHENGIGLYLLGRALHEAGEPAAAAEAYREFLALSPPAGELVAERDAARLRLGLALIQAGQRPQGEARLAELGVAGTPWLRVLEADALAAAGDTAAVTQLLAGVDDGVAGLRAWRARVAAARAAGDLAGARALANRARAWASTDDTRAEFLLLAAIIAAEMGDTAAARDAWRGVIDRGAGNAHARRAADLLLQGPMSGADHLAVARVQAAQGLHEQAVEHYRSALDAGATGSDVHYELASSLFYSEQYREVEDALSPIAGRSDARMLLARTEAQRGRTDRAVRLYLDSNTGVEGLFIAAGTLHDAGELERATELYRRVIARYPGSDRMGLALMRLAGIAYQQEEWRAAAALWDRYRTAYPRGDRWLQATYWAARAREQAGDEAAAAELYRAIRQRERDSYYALLASRRLGEEFWPLAMSASPAADAAAERQVRAWMRELDLLREAGFHDAASARADELAAQTGLERATRYALAEALAARGYSQGAIRIGIGLGTAAPPDLRLLRILYPFPYRTLITEEARDRGIDPSVVAALIRQESMFEARITSPAGARGLMQIMPATGAQLAEAVGIERWDAEMLYRPEINVHLGTRYVAQFLEEYDGSLPSVFSAYNAGPHRVEWWSEFPEYGEDELFTERIPYRETRNYVKILTRNRALYEGLYGGDATAP